MLRRDMLTTLDKLLFGASPAKASAVSAALHTAALAGLALWSVPAPADRPEFAGSRSVVEVTLSTALPEPERSLVETLSETSVTIMPHRAELAEHRFIDVPAELLPARETIPLDLIELAMADRFASQAADESPRPPQPRDARRAVEESMPAVTEPRPSPAPRESRPVPPLPSSRAEVPRNIGTDATTPPDFTNNRPPRYPELARRQGIEGTVLLRLFVAADGRVREVEVAESSGHPILDAEAVTAVRSWRGRPATRDGVPVETVELLPVRFRLR
jgi:protein TonB